MTVTAHTYTKLGLSLATKKIDLTADTLKAALLASYTVGTTQDDAQFVSDIITGGVGVEVANGNGYTTGGVALASVTFTKTGHVYKLSCNDPAWAAATITASHALFYDSTPGSAATNPILCYWDFGGNVVSTAGTFTLTVSASGLITVTGS